jgi:hypothetical protein
MYTSTLLSVAFAAVAAAQSTLVTSVSYDNPLTAYLTQTDSNGVITGMPTQPAVVTSIPTQPAVVTSQPGVVTSQPLVASIYAGLTTGTNTVLVGNQTQTVFFSGDITSVIKATPTPTAAKSSGGSSGSGTSASGSAASASSSGSSASGHIKAGAGALVGAGALFAAFL